VNAPTSNRTLARVEPRDVAEQIIAGMRAGGIELLFTVMGGPLMPFLRACRQRRFPQVVVCRHEVAAAMMAAAYFHDRGAVAALAVTSGPGAANATNGIVHALREQAAVLILSARPAAAKVGRGAVQDFDTARFLAPLTKRSEELLHASQTDFLVDELIQTARAPVPGPVNLTVCADQWAAPCRSVP
jgi:acetolactate synthase-1/2/3 large subunit